MADATLQHVKTALSKLPKKKAPAQKMASTLRDVAGPKLVAVLIRGREIGVRHDVVRTLNALLLHRRHICVVFKDSESTRGMMLKCKDLITFGPITEETFKLLSEKRGSLKDKKGNPLHVFRMHPPRGGYGNKGIKVAYQEGGCLGLRRKGMDDFLKKMM